MTKPIYAHLGAFEDEHPTTAELMIAAKLAKDITDKQSMSVSTGQTVGFYPQATKLSDEWVSVKGASSLSEANCLAKQACCKKEIDPYASLSQKEIEELNKGREDLYTDSTNPKDLFGEKKVRLGYCPPSLEIAASLAFTEGASKYGAYNWRDKSIRMTIYLEAASRHLKAYFDGEDIDSDSGLPHTFKALACIGLIIEGVESGNIIDDRPKAGPAADMLKKYANFTNTKK